MTSLTRSRFLSCLAAGAAALAAPAAFAQQGYPDRPIKLIVPFAPGGATDILGRLLAAGLSDKLGQPVVVENRPGAGTVVVCGLVARAPPDGYTLFLGASSTLTYNPAIRAQLPYDPLHSFTPLGMVADMGLVLVANPAKDVIPYVPAVNYSAKDSWLKANEATARCFQAALIEANTLALADDAKLIRQARVDHNKTDPAVAAAATISGYETDISVNGFKILVDGMTEFDFIDKPVTLDDVLSPITPTRD